MPQVLFAPDVEPKLIGNLKDIVKRHNVNTSNN
jgi:hypothetical protein